MARTLRETALPYNPEIHHRRSIRLKSYDYSEAGAYFVTICTHGRRCWFGEVKWDEEANVILDISDAGQMIEHSWLDLEVRFVGLTLDEWQLMPNHLHGIVVLPADFEFSFFDVMHDFKSWTTTAYCRGVHAGDFASFEKRFWHRNYFERVIRDDQELENARHYIRNNLSKWSEDKLNPTNPLQKRNS